MKTMFLLLGFVGLALGSLNVEASCRGGKKVYLCRQLDGRQSIFGQFTPPKNEIELTTAKGVVLDHTQNCSGDLEFFVASKPLVCQSSAFSYRFFDVFRTDGITDPYTLGALELGQNRGSSVSTVGIVTDRKTGARLAIGCGGAILCPQN